MVCKQARRLETSDTFSDVLGLAAVIGSKAESVRTLQDPQRISPKSNGIVQRFLRTLQLIRNHG